ncbi:unnamed protein product, partial [Prorocentrum cordatum]
GQGRPPPVALHAAVGRPSTRGRPCPGSLALSRARWARLAAPRQLPRRGRSRSSAASGPHSADAEGSCDRKAAGPSRSRGQRGVGRQRRGHHGTSPPWPPVRTVEVDMGRTVTKTARVLSILSQARCRPPRGRGPLATESRPPNSGTIEFEQHLLVGTVPMLSVLTAGARSPGLLGYLGDRWQTDADVEAARAEFWAQGELVLLCVLLFAGGVAVAVAGLCASTAAACAVSVCVMAVLLFAHSVLLAPNIAALCVFLMVQGSLSWSIGSVEYYFYTDDAEVYPEGPHFSTVFYNSVLSPASSIAQLGCVWLYGRYMNGWSYRNTMVVGNVAAILTRLMQAAMFARLNVALGISDYILLLVGHTDGRARFLQWLPSMVVASLVCPKGMETTVFALLAACRGFGETVGSDCGALLLEMLGADPDGSVGDEDAFENAWKASLIVSVLPLLTLPFIFALVPDASPSSDRGRLASGQAVEGSLVRRWWGRGARRQLV